MEQKDTCLSAAQIEQIAASPENGIIGVQFKILKSHGDNRGFFREVFRESEPIFSGGHFAQWSHSFMQKDVVKAWHYHHKQYDWWYVPLGQVLVALIDFREDSSTYKKKLLFMAGSPSDYGPDTHELAFRIPPGVLHGCRVLSENAHLFYITSETYNPSDEGRYPYHSAEVDHDWGEEAIVVDNDKKRFVPTEERIRINST